MVTAEVALSKWRCKIKLIYEKDGIIIRENIRKNESDNFSVSELKKDFEQRVQSFIFLHK